jgi:AcrR family transcriptional regulator
MGSGFVHSPPTTNGRKRPSDRAAARREQIIEAAVAVIAEKGLPKLSLSEIEKRAGMCRGQLTYYFPTKESILLGVFDRLLQLMYQRIGTPRGPTVPCTEQASAWEWVQHLLGVVLQQPPTSPEFHCLQYTFLSQIGHRDDFRQRLARLYEEWRSTMTAGFAHDLSGQPDAPAADPRLLATLVQAILHGLSMQLAADPGAFNREAMYRLCLDVLGNYLHLAAPETDSSQGTAAPAVP